MIDRFASQYGWDISNITRHTFYQLDHLSEQIEDRVSQERRLLADTFRVASHGQRVPYNRFIEGLKVVKKKISSLAKAKPPTRPKGFGYADKR